MGIYFSMLCFICVSKNIFLLVLSIYTLRQLYIYYVYGNCDDDDGYLIRCDSEKYIFIYVYVLIYSISFNFLKFRQLLFLCFTYVSCR